jgi:metalloprotein, YbeY/UPF0054 family
MMKDEPHLSFPAHRRALRPPSLSRKHMIVETNFRLRPSDRARFARFLIRAQREIGLIGEVNVVFATNSEMQRLNRQFRRKNRPTDVLSFPAPMTDRGPQTAGDIAISVNMARENAAALGHSLESELKILILHGVLHLAGHDHEQDNGEMAALENQLRAKLKLPTGLIERNLGNGEKSARRPRPTLRKKTPRGRGRS